MGACSTFSLKKNVSVTSRSVTNWKFRIAACTSWRKAFDRSNIDLVARDPGLSTRSFLPHFLSISTHHFGHWLQETLHHLPSNAYQTFHNRLQPWELWEEPAFFSFFQINSGRDVNDSYCHHECKVKQVGAPSLRYRSRISGVSRWYIRIIQWYIHVSNWFIRYIPDRTIVNAVVSLASIPLISAVVRVHRQTPVYQSLQHILSW